MRDVHRAVYDVGREIALELGLPSVGAIARQQHPEGLPGPLSKVVSPQPELLERLGARHGLRELKQAGVRDPAVL